MELIKHFIDIILHLDKYLGVLINNFGTWSYFILFSIIFAETGFVVTPFLPGDSLLFAIGAFAGLGSFKISWLLGLLTGAAIIGDSVNYAIGKAIGDKAFTYNSKFFKREYLEKTHKFYEKHGGKTIILARFIPIIRTFAPFVAGIGKMTYSHFLFYNIIGGMLWVGSFLLAGYFFGNMPVVKHNFSLVILGVIAVSLLPIVFEFINHKREKRT